MIAVIIPTRNAASTLPATLAALQPGQNLISEIIISDAGSTDGTANLAPEKLITGPPSRGGQIRAGIAASKAPFLLILHADSILPETWPAIIEPALKTPQYGHYFRLRFASDKTAARLLEAIAALRCAAAKLPYGDQGLLISRSLLAESGGYPDIPLMEDVALARRLRNRLRPLPAAILTSAVKYECGGWLRRPLKNACCLSLYFAGMPPAKIQKIYD
jgi:rSAM/selenodomain-associated transferase 2